VGAIDFDPSGGVIGYQKIVSGTQHNCGGGKTPWNSWISGEERAKVAQCRLTPRPYRPRP
jgi:secreted PhoX family phosphatase